MSEAGVLIASICVGGTFMGLTALGLTYGKDLVQGDARQVLALMTWSFGVGQIAGPSLAGFAVDHFHSFTVPLLAAAFALVGSGVLVLNR